MFELKTVVQLQIDQCFITVDKNNFHGPLCVYRYHWWTLNLCKRDFKKGSILTFVILVNTLDPLYGPLVKNL